MREIWKSIQGFEGLYEISNFGRVKILKKRGKKEGILKPTLNPKHKYLQARLWKNKKLSGPYFHRLVAIHFIPNPLNLPEVNHIDGNKTNNHIDNLEWCTKSQNRQHALKLGLWKHSDSHKKATADFNRRTKSKVVLQYDLESNFIQEFSSTEEAANSVGGSQGNIANCCAGKKYYNSVKGFIFKYKHND